MKHNKNDHFLVALYKNEITEVDFGWSKFGIQIVDNLRDKDEVVVDGLTDFTHQLLFVNTDLSSDRAKEVLFHEVLHAAYEGFGLDPEDSTHVKITNENLVSITTKLIFLIKNLNPGLIGLLL
jgi:hypothetical protein